MSGTEKIIEITRTLDAPAELVFRCWTQGEHLLHWCSAGDGWTTPHARTEPRLGGRFNVGFAGPDGKTGFDFTGTYTEFTPPTATATGYLTSAIDDGRPVRVVFEPKGSQTFVTIHLPLEPTHSEEQQRHGWTAMLANLERYIATRKAA